MSRNYKILPWDTEQFGYKVAELNNQFLSVEELYSRNNEFRNEGGKLAYLFIDSGDKRRFNELKNAGLTPVDNKITLRLKLNNEHYTKYLSPNINEYKLAYVSPELLNIVLQAGVYSRFKTDTGFKGGEYEKLYKIWINESVKGNLAKKIFVFEKNSVLAGMFSVDVKDDCGKIILVAVDSNFRGESVGKSLMQAALNYFIGSGLNRAEVVTQLENLPAVNFYEKFGFTICSHVYIYHFWL